MAPKSVSFDPSRDIPPLKGKVILVTGGCTGLGKQSALELAKHAPSQVWVTGRNAERAMASIAEIQAHAPNVAIRFLELDLTSFDSTLKAANIFLTSAPRLNILMLNAGIMAVPPGQTKEGYEITFGTNHLGHALLFKLLTPLLLKSSNNPPRSDIRVVITSSNGHRFVPAGGIRFDSLATDGSGVSISHRYGQSKLANVLYAREISKRYPQLKAVSVHPGTIKTDLHQSNGGSLLIRLFQSVVLPFVGQSVEEGVKNQLWASTATDIVSGEYYEPVGVSGKGGTYSANDELARRLWEWTERQLDTHVKLGEAKHSG
ncbi:dehydrogenase reductase SDR member 13 [Aspergillus pseudoviridinutans]|uniref:Dehydrogenase reductase SDR member 13 n=1 Tax=Aspergillus pseudoviridinutans TaxID=1517512 RepID=A0A9P3B8X2_9EURO|nr:dehydrogenase reductase SDR member 13 [Aspergillus pseudoviridinutans]GIJ86896.1 dehydrogenase reductase SDR member 13 [Aspergillus pseudoviridinutans]